MIYPEHTRIQWLDTIMFSPKTKQSSTTSAPHLAHIPSKCRCGGQPTKPTKVAGVSDRWVIKCRVEACYAYNIGQGLNDTIAGWNHLSTHFYR